MIFGVLEEVKKGQDAIIKGQDEIKEILKKIEQKL
jgi:hypothetical protein